MNDRNRCSVIMATYNGEMYITEQLESVLKNMKENDELIISDDGSSDNTKKIIQSYMNCNKNIRLIDGPKSGVTSNFENALRYVQGDVIFLCDQDDVWSDHKIDTVLSAMKDDVTLVMHDAMVIQDEKVIYPSFMQHRGSKVGLFHNIIKNSYIGCCMAFKRELLDYILPFPEKICMHDQWIGLVNEKYGKSICISDKLIQYRRHGNNASTMAGYGLLRKIKNRSNMLFALIKRVYK